MCGVYEPLQNATTGCCWALRRERCIFPCGVVPDGIEWGSDDRGGDSGETSGEREPRRAPDDAERFADAWRSVVTEREANQSDVDMSGRDSAEQGMPPGGDGVDLVCVGCGAEHVQARAMMMMMMCPRCEASVCYPGCTVRCPRCDAATYERCACRCSGGVALGGEGGDREKSDPDDDDSDSGGESGRSGGWYRGMPENDRTVSRRRRKWMPPFRMVARRPLAGPDGARRTTAIAAAVRTSVCATLGGVLTHPGGNQGGGGPGAPLAMLGNGFSGRNDPPTGRRSRR